MSSGSASGGDIFGDDAANLEEILQRFEEAWNRGESPQIEDYVPDGPLRDATLLELVQVDLERRLRSGQPARVNDYLKRFQNFTFDDSDVLDLIKAEVNLRQEREQNLCRDEYVSRFRHLADQLPHVLPDLPQRSPADSSERVAEDSENADRNMLFGILALQNNFIGRAQLLAAFQLWVKTKAVSVGRMLLQQHAIDEDEYKLLSALVEKQLEKHGHDCSKSLTALSSVGSVGDDLKIVDDPDVHASIAHLSATTEHKPRPSKTKSKPERFRIIRPHAKGGLGEVFVAEDTELNREVALKEIQSQHANPDSQDRFLREAEITAALEHPGVVPVYGLGQYADGRPFYAMKFVKGASLQEAIVKYHDEIATAHDASDHMLDLRRLLSRFMDVCNAVQYAHKKGILHRDLKPGNIMLGKHGETLVVDWGLAKPVDKVDDVHQSAEATVRPVSGSGQAPTELGSKLGTPAYMSPEQAKGQIDELGPATDVYGLGATLYHLLTGHPPFDRQSTDEHTDAVLQRIGRGEFRNPRSVNPNTPPALDAICHKAMSLEPENRYPSPKALARDIEAWLGDEPVSAKSETILSKAARFFRRHRNWTVSGVIALLIFSIVSSTLLIALKRQQLLAVSLREDVDSLEAKRQSVLKQAQAMHLVSESQFIRDREHRTSLRLAIEALETARQVGGPTVSFAHRNLRNSLSRVGGRGLAECPDEVRDLGFSPDSRRLAVASADGYVRLWEPGVATPPKALAHDGSVTALAFAGDSQRLATATSKRIDTSASTNCVIRVWNLADTAGDPLEVSSLELPVGADQESEEEDANIGADFKQLLYGDSWTEDAVETLVFSSSGEWLAGACSDGTLQLWNVNAKRDYSLHKYEQLHSVRISDDERWLISVGQSAVHLWDLTADNPAIEPIKIRCDIEYENGGYAFSSGCKRMVIARGFRWAPPIVCDMSQANPLESPQSLADAIGDNMGDISALTLDASGRYLVIGYGEGENSQLWDLSTKEKVVIPDLRIDHDSLFDPTGRWLFAPKNEVWELLNGMVQQRGVRYSPSKLHTVVPELGFFVPKRLSRDGRWLAVAGRGGVSLHDLSGDIANSGNSLVLEADGPIWDAALDQRSKVVVAGGYFSYPNEWKLAGGLGEKRRAFKQASVDHCEIAPTGDWGVTTSSAIMKVWRLGPMESMGPELELPGKVHQLGIAPNGRWIATRLDTGILLWKVANDGATTASIGPAIQLQGNWFAFVAGGRRLITRKEETLVFWNIEGQSPVETFRGLGSSNGSLGVGIDPSGQWLVTHSQHEFRVWNVDGPQPTSSGSVSGNGLPPYWSEDLSVSPTGEWLLVEAKNAMLSSNRELWILSLKNEADRFRLAESRGRYNEWKTVSFAPSGRWLVVGFDEGNVRLHDLDAADMRVPINLIGHESPITSIEFSRDGTWFLTASYDGTIRCWDVDTDRLLRHARNVAGRDLTKQERKRFMIEADIRTYIPTKRDVRATKYNGIGRADEIAAPSTK